MTIYANNAGTSWPKAPGVFEACSKALATAPEDNQDILRAARAEACWAFGIEQPERLLLTSSCTAALALAIGDFPLAEGDVVLTSSLEHHALTRPLQRLARTRGVVHEAAPYASGAPFDLEFAQRLLKQGRVRLIAVTAASNITGELLPIEALGQLAREHAVPLLLDAAQMACVAPIDVRATPVDMLVFAGHKGPLASHGIAGLWAAPHVSFHSPAAMCELDSETREAFARPGAAGACASFPGDCDAGSTNLAAAAGLAAALSWRRAQPADPFVRPRALAQRLRGELRSRAGCQLFGTDAAPSTATVSFRIDRLPLARAEAHFARRGIALRAGQHCASLALQAIGVPEGTLRVSFGPFNREHDVDAILDAVDGAAAWS